MKPIAVLAAAALLAAPALSAPCRDGKGKYIKCPSASAATNGVTKGADGRCRGTKGRFVACPK